jgi:hypothetical protein
VRACVGSRHCCDRDGFSIWGDGESQANRAGRAPVFAAVASSLSFPRFPEAWALRRDADACSGTSRRPADLNMDGAHERHQWNAKSISGPTPARLAWDILCFARWSPPCYSYYELANNQLHECF